MTINELRAREAVYIAEELWNSGKKPRGGLDDDELDDTLSTWDKEIAEKNPQNPRLQKVPGVLAQSKANLVKIQLLASGGDFPLCNYMFFTNSMSLNY